MKKKEAENKKNALRKIRLSPASWQWDKT